MGIGNMYLNIFVGQVKIIPNHLKLKYMHADNLSVKLYGFIISVSILNNNHILSMNI